MVTLLKLLARWDVVSRLCRPAWIVALIACVVLTGCNRAESPRVSVMECVPGDAVIVKAVDLEALFREAGCRMSLSADSLCAEAMRVVSLVVEPDSRDALAAVLLAGGVVRSDVVCFTTAAGHEIVAMPVTDSTALADGLSGWIGKEGFVEDGGLEHAAVCGRVVAVDGGRCFIAPDFNVLLDVLEQAGGSQFNDLPGVGKFLEGEGYVAKVVADCGSGLFSFCGGSDGWLCVGVKVSPVSVSAEAAVMDGKGRLVPIGCGFDLIDTDFLRYTPHDAAVVLAFGKFSGDTRWPAKLLGRFAPDYLGQADGTTSLYALPAGGVQSVADAAPGAWNVETMVHVPEDAVPALINQYRARAKWKARDIGGQWCCLDGDETSFFGCFDGALVFSTNREISSGYSNSFAEDFAGKRAAMVVDIPSGGVLARAWQLPCGLTFKAGLGREWVRARISFNGTSEPAFKALLSLPQLPEVKSRWDATGR